MAAINLFGSLRLGRIISLPILSLLAIVLAVLVLSFYIATAPLDPDPLASMDAATASADVGDSERMTVEYANVTDQSIREGASMAATADYLEARLPVRFRIRIIKGEAEFLSRIAAGEFDLLFMGPLRYVAARERTPIVPLVAVLNNDGRFYQGAIVAADPSIRRIEDLHGKRVTYVDRNSASGYLFPTALALQHGVDPLRDCRLFEASGGHRNVYHNFSQGRYDAGFVVADDNQLSDRSSAIHGARGASSVQSVAGSDSNSYRVLGRTVWIPTPLLAITPGFASRAPEFVERLRQEFLRMGNDSEGQRILSSHYHEQTGFALASDTEYEPVREVRAILRGHGYLE